MFEKFLELFKCSTLRSFFKHNSKYHISNDISLQSNISNICTSNRKFIIRCKLFIRIKEYIWCNCIYLHVLLVYIWNRTLFIYSKHILLLHWNILLNINNIMFVALVNILVNLIYVSCILNLNSCWNFEIFFFLVDICNLFVYFTRN